MTILASASASELELPITQCCGSYENLPGAPVALIKWCLRAASPAINLPQGRRARARLGAVGKRRREPRRTWGPGRGAQADTAGHFRGDPSCQRGRRVKALRKHLLLRLFIDSGPELSPPPRSERLICSLKLPNYLATPRSGESQARLTLSTLVLQV